MPLPTPGDQHVNSLLTQISVAFVNQPGAFVADLVFPRLGVEKQSDVFAVYNRGDLLRDEMQRRGPGAESAGGGYRTTTDSYRCDVWAFHKDVDDQTLANTDAPYNAFRDATIYVTEKEKIKREVEFVTNWFTTGVWTGSTSGSDLVAGSDFTAWDDVASDPVGLISDNCEAIEGATGRWPNTLTLNRKGWNALKNHPDIVDRIAGAAGPGSPAIATRQAVAAILELDRILVASSVKNSAQENVTASVGYIVGNHALLSYAPAVPSLMEPSAGYTFTWSGLTGSQEGRRIKRFRMEANAADRVEIEAAFDQKVVSALCGAFFSNVAS